MKYLTIKENLKKHIHTIFGTLLLFGKTIKNKVVIWIDGCWSTMFFILLIRLSLYN